MEEKIITNSPHNIIIENRKEISATGVTEIDSFDLNTIIAFTSFGELTILGEDLRIVKFNNDSGDLNVSGTIRAISYSEQNVSPKNFFGKLFK